MYHTDLACTCTFNFEDTGASGQAPFKSFLLHHEQLKQIVLYIAFSFTEAVILLVSNQQNDL